MVHALHEALTAPWSTPEQISWNIQIALMGTLICLTCGLVGTFIVIRRMSLLGDAISHGILPGIVIAYLITDSLALGPIWLGACLAGLGCGFLIEWFRTKTPLREDAAMGLTFTSFFAVGIVLLSIQVDHVHLDPACILYGEIGLLPLQGEFILGGQSLGNQALWAMGAVCFTTIALCFAFYRLLLVTSFDLSLAKSLGIPIQLVQYGLMLILCLVLTASFESVGVILVLAMMILPPLSSSFLFTRLPVMLLSCLPFSFLYAIGGIHLAHLMNFPISASIAVVGVVLFIPCCLFGSKGGLLLHLPIMSKENSSKNVLS